FSLPYLLERREGARLHAMPRVTGVESYEQYLIQNCRSRGSHYTDKLGVEQSRGSSTGRGTISDCRSADPSRPPTNTSGPVGTSRRGVLTTSDPTSEVTVHKEIQMTHVIAKRRTFYSQRSTPTPDSDLLSVLKYLRRTLYRQHRPWDSRRIPKILVLSFFTVVEVVASVVPSFSLCQPPFSEGTQFADVTGDGKADALVI